MYIPEHFTVENSAWAHEIMRTHSFATLVSGTTKLTASHLPLLWTSRAQGHGVIQGHMARANSQWQDFTEDVEIMAIFTGHHAYISPNWYVSRPAVPTWNYAAVHAYGVPRVIDNQPDGLTLELETVLSQRESTRNIEEMREDLQEVCTRISEKLDSADGQQKKLILDALQVEVTVTGQKVNLGLELGVAPEVSRLTTTGRTSA